MVGWWVSGWMPGARVTAIDAAAIAVIAVAGEVSWATAPASAALTPCIVSMPEECSPRAWPLRSCGVTAISRSCWTRLAPKPTEATRRRRPRRRARRVAGRRAGTAWPGAAGAGCPGRAPRRGGMSRPAAMSPASMPEAAKANSSPRGRGRRRRRAIRSRRSGRSAATGRGRCGGAAGEDQSRALVAPGPGDGRPAGGARRAAGQAEPGDERGREYRAAPGAA